MNSITSYDKIDLLFEILSQNQPIWEVISKIENLNLPDCYVGAGCIAQTVWNHYHGFKSSANINDIDVVYFDRSDLSFEKENEVINSVSNYFSHFPIKLDIKNQARVHLWYKDHFGYDITPYKSLEEAVSTWPTTATSIAVNLEKNQPKVIAPFGLTDLFDLIVRPNKKQITAEIYNNKLNRWRTHWPKLKIIPW